MYILNLNHNKIILGTPPSIEKPYGPYPVLVTNHKNKTVPILQAYANTKYIGKVDLKFDPNGELLSINGKPTLLDHNIQQGKQSFDMTLYLIKPIFIVIILKLFTLVK